MITSLVLVVGQRQWRYIEPGGAGPKFDTGAKTDGVRRAIDAKVAIIGMEDVVVARIDRIGDATTVYSDDPLVEHTAKVGVKTVSEVSGPTRNETCWNSINPSRQYL
jgi:hypothetical protein